MSQILTLEQLVQNSNKIESLKEAKEIIGGSMYTTGFSIATKMPCYTYSTPAIMCNTGSKMRKVKGSICSDCFACPSESQNHHSGGWYEMDRVMQPMIHRLLQIEFNPRWTDAMIFLFKHYKWDIFRWHDSGDIRHKKHFEDLCKIADAVPETKFWLPTQEWDIVWNYWNEHGRVLLKELHPNLIIRLSARMIDGEPPLWMARKMGVQVSRVSTKDSDVNCPAVKQANNCGTCRKCWNQDIESITYHYHDGHDKIMQSEYVMKIKKDINDLLSQGMDKSEMYSQLSEKYSIQKINIRIIYAKLKRQKQLMVLN